MAHKVYHGKTGVIYNVTKSAVGVIMYKKVGNRYLEKRINVRLEHINHSRSREEFINRVKSNAQRRKDAKSNGETVQLKRLPQGPRDAHTVELKEVESLAPQAYDTHI
jgi:large subunit ribosomal protein L21e